MPSVGPISANDFRSVFGDTGDTRLSNWYRGGPFVDASFTSTNITAGSWTSFQGPSGLTTGGGIVPPPDTAWLTATSTSTGTVAFRRIYWNGSLVGSPGSFYRFIVGGYQYEIGSLDPTATYVGGGYEYRYSSVRRRTYSSSTTTTSVNTQVPTSGEISFNDLRGADNY